MPLSCLQGGDLVLSFRLDETAWRRLADENRRLQHLSMCCCGSPVVLKKSKYGTRFFAHARRGQCNSASESDFHLLAKEVVATAVENFGWTARVEYRHPSGAWIADVLAEKDGRRIAFEIQLSPQTIYDTFQRHERYREHGVDCVWLFGESRSGLNANVGPPLFFLQTDEVPFSVVSGCSGIKRSLNDFVYGVLAGRFRHQGSGINDELERVSSIPLSAKTERDYVCATINDALLQGGWSVVRDLRFQAGHNQGLDETYDALPFCRIPGRWCIDLLAFNNGTRIAFHVALSAAAVVRAAKQIRQAGDFYAGTGIYGVWLTGDIGYLKRRLLSDPGFYVMQLARLRRETPIYLLNDNDLDKKPLCKLEWWLEKFLERRLYEKNSPVRV